MTNTVSIDLNELTRIIIRIAEVSEQLDSSLQSNVSCFTTLYSHDIKSQTVTNIIEKYNENTSKLKDETIKNLELCKKYLEGKLGSYSRINNVAVENLRLANERLQSLSNE